MYVIVYITDFQLRYINPLAVNVVVVDVLTAGRDALVSVVLTVVVGILPLAQIVLQTEGGLVRVGVISVLLAQF